MRFELFRPSLIGNTFFRTSARAPTGGHRRATRQWSIRIALLNGVNLYDYQWLVRWIRSGDTFPVESRCRLSIALNIAYPSILICTCSRQNQPNHVGTDAIGCCGHGAARRRDRFSMLSLIVSNFVLVDCDCRHDKLATKHSAYRTRQWIYRIYLQITGGEQKSNRNWMALINCHL